MRRVDRQTAGRWQELTRYWPSQGRIPTFTSAFLGLATKVQEMFLERMNGLDEGDNEVKHKGGGRQAGREDD